MGSFLLSTHVQLNSMNVSLRLFDAVSFVGAVVVALDVVVIVVVVVRMGLNEFVGSISLH